MIKTKFQGIIFGLLMSYVMAYGMEIYNIAIKMGYQATNGGLSNMTNQVFVEAFIEALYMGIFVFVFSNLWGNKMGAKFADKYCDPQRDNAYFCRLMRQAGTVAIMCPTMSLVASILFNIILAKGSLISLPAIWVGTLLKNFPMAFFWNMFGAAPFVHWIFLKLFHNKHETIAHS